MSRWPSGAQPRREIDGFAADRRFVANLHAQRVEEHDGIHPLERSALPRGHFRDDPVGHRANEIGRDLHGVHLRQEALNLADRHPARVEREDLVVEARQPPLVFGNETRLKSALAVAWYLDRERPVVGQDRFVARPVAMIGRIRWLGAAPRIAQMVRQLAAQGALDDRFLEPAHRSLELLVGDRTLANELVENLRRDRRQRRVRCQALSFATHRHSSCYASHTKFRTPSPSRTI